MFCFDFKLLVRLKRVKDMKEMTDTDMRRHVRKVGSMLS